MASALWTCLAAGDTASAAACAWRDIIKPVFIGFFAQIRICKKRTSHRYTVYQTALYNICCIADIIDLSNNKNRDIYYFFDFRCFIYIYTDALGSGRDDMLQSSYWVPPETSSISTPAASNLGARYNISFERVASDHTFVAGNTQEDRKIPAYIFPDFFNDFQNKSCAVVQTSAVFIHSFVAERRQERTGKHIGVSAVKTDAAASGFFRPACSLTVLFYDLLDFFYRNRTADMTVGVYIGRRSERCDLTVSANRFGTCMDDLRNQNTSCSLTRSANCLNCGTRLSLSRDVVFPI